MFQEEEEAESRSSFSLTEVSFSGSQDNFFTVVSDMGQPYNAPHYGRRISKPVAYVRDSKMSISANIEFNGIVSEENTISLRLQLDDFFDRKTSHTFIVPAEEIRFTNVDENKTNITINNLEIDIINIPDKVYWKDNYSITFEAAIVDRGEDITSIDKKRWQKAGETKNDIYVLFDKPNINEAFVPTDRKLFESLLFITCRNDAVQKATTQQGLIDAVWSIFSTGNVSRNSNLKRKDGTTLKYYNPHSTSVWASDMLLIIADGNGQCGAFAKLFLNMLLAHGVPVDNMKYVMFGVDPNMSNFEVCILGFMVKDWRFSTKGTSYTLNNVSFTHTNSINFTHTNIGRVPSESSVDYHRFEVTEVTDRTGIPGQNSPNPASMFNNHQIVKVGDTYYDPSYGVSYTDRTKIKDDIQGVYYEHWDRYNGERVLHYRMKEYDPNELPLLFY